MMKLPAQFAALLTLAGFAASTPLVSSAQAQGMHAIYTFGPAPDGAQPNGGLVRDSVGRLYGVTALGGTYGYGTIYRLTHHDDNSWTEEILHSFNNADGSQPIGQLLIDSGGTLYGTTVGGGSNSSGTVYRLDEYDEVWTLTTLHNFGELGGSQDLNFPINGLSFGPNGLLFGTAVEAGAGDLGGVFSVSPDPNEPDGYTILLAFSRQFGDDDGGPTSPLIVTDDGHLIGLENNFMQSQGDGIAFDLYKADSVWKETVAYRFQGPPNDAVVIPGTKTIVRGFSGTLVGCGYGGAYRKGAIYTLTRPSNRGSQWIENILYDFGAVPDDSAIEDLCGITVAPDGTIFGTTGEGGKYGLGTLFHLTPPVSGEGPWQNLVLHNFSKGGQDGRVPIDGLLRVGENYYGVVTSSNHNGPGDVFVIRP